MIDKIPADENTVMTPLIRRAFLMVKCDPACHSCDREIAVGDNFKLASTPKPSFQFPDATVDVMLCNDCTTMDYTMRIEMEKDQVRRGRVEYFASRGHGFIRPHLVKT